MVSDFERTMSPGDIFTYGSSSVFTLSETNINSITSVLRNDVVLSESSYSFNSTNNKLTISSYLTTGDTIEIQYTYYSNYSNSEIESYIRAAAVHLSINGYTTWEIDSLDNFYPDLTNSEVNLIATIASILMDPPISNIRLPDVSLGFPEKLSAHEKIKKLISHFKRDGIGYFNLVDSNSEDSINNI